MATKKKAATTASSVNVFKGTNFKTFAGPNITVDVKFGALLVLNGSDVVCVFGPSEWTTVNTQPI